MASTVEPNEKTLLRCEAKTESNETWNAEQERSCDEDARSVIVAPLVVHETPGDLTSSFFTACCSQGGALRLTADTRDGNSRLYRSVPRFRPVDAADQAAKTLAVSLVTDFLHGVLSYRRGQPKKILHRYTK